MAESGSAVRKLLHRFVPSQFEDPFGLAGRLIRSRDRAAHFAMASTFLGLATTPLDLVLALRERKRYEAAGDPRWPILLVCGPARSGTTLVAQTLIHCLPVGFFNNLTSIFTRSPLTALAVFGPLLRPPPVDFRSFYGKTDGWAAPNDALYLWDRWLGTERNRPVASISAEKAREMRRFFGAAEAGFGKPIVTKNNNLIGAAAAVAEALPTAHFICLERNPLFLAQALLLARQEIHGREDTPYGLSDGIGPADPIDNVCHQVRLVTALGRQAAAALGPQRFTLLSYEAFCANPNQTVARFADLIGGATGAESVRAPIPPFAASGKLKVAPGIMDRFRQSLGDLAQIDPGPESA